MLYLDASALVKRYVAEEGSEEILGAMAEAKAWAICRIGYVETARAVGLATGQAGLRRLAREWPSFDVIEIDTELAEQAADLALAEELRSLDALHLAAALLLDSDDMTVATWDARLHRAARRQGLAVLPNALD